MKGVITEQLFCERLREGGRRATPQRIVLLRVLGELGGHASADDVLRAAGDRLPQLALPTVYATLDLFEELGLVRAVRVPNGPTLYEPRGDGHHHAACRRCGQVIDLPPSVDDAGALAAARAAGFAPDRAEVVVVGLCPACATA